MREKEILQAVQTACQDILGEDLTGIYLHGSLAFGCFRWEKSDIDFLVVTERPPRAGQKQALIAELLRLDAQAPPKGFEMSVILAGDCAPLVYPTPYQLHFSNDHKQGFIGDLAGYCEKMQGVDKDLAAHITVLRAAGYPLCGKPVEAVFAPVPKEAYLDSILWDVKNAPEEIEAAPVYFLLNLCRVLAYLESGCVLSKAQGGAWGVRFLPEPCRAAVKNALENYRADVPFTEREHLRTIAQELCRRIEEKRKSLSV